MIGMLYREQKARWSDEKYYQTLREAKKALKQNPYGYDLRIWDLGKHRKKRRFFVGTKLEWLNFAR